MEHLNQQGSIVTCPVVMFIRDGKIMTGLRHYKKKDADIVSVWTIPGGRCDTGETIEQTLRREVLEEVGIKDFAIIDFLGIIAGAKEGDIVYVFAGATDQEPILMEPEKFSEWKWCAFESLPENLISDRVFKLAQNFWNKRINS